jgi:hypothetical protein
MWAVFYISFSLFGGCTIRSKRAGTRIDFSPEAAKCVLGLWLPRTRVSSHTPAVLLAPSGGRSSRGFWICLANARAAAAQQP